MASFVEKKLQITFQGITGYQAPVDGEGAAFSQARGKCVRPSGLAEGACAG